MILLFYFPKFLLLCYNIFFKRRGNRKAKAAKHQKQTNQSYASNTYQLNLSLSHLFENN